MKPIKCEICGRFMSDKDLRVAAQIPNRPSDPYEAPEYGFAHRECDERVTNPNKATKPK